MTGSCRTALIPSSSLSPEEATIPAAQRENARTVLLVSSVDEDPRRLRDIFRGSGWNVQWVRTCREAVDYARHHPVTVILTERDLPACHGTWKDLLRQVAEIPNGPPVIVASLVADECLWAEVLNLGGYDVLAKPFECKEVTWSVNVVLAQWQQSLVRTLRGGAMVTGRQLAAS